MAGENRNSGQPAKRRRESSRGGWGSKSRKTAHGRHDDKRKAYNTESAGRRERVRQTREKQTERGEERPIWAVEFTEEEIKNEERRTKNKVALIFGYAGTGYHGLQIERTHPTIEGDLFRACVQAGAVSKANADDPKKLSWVRCSRTDRNVHAAANVISAQLIVQDEDIVQRINEHLTPTIRVWGYEKLNKTFNAHQRCEGRVYQYWIPTYCFLPPHPRSFLGSQLEEIAKEVGQADEYHDRQKEVADFWAKADEEFIAPVLKNFDAEVGAKALEVISESRLQAIKKAAGAEANGESSETPAEGEGANPALPPQLEAAIKAIKEAFKLARRSYRLDETRLSRVRACMSEFQGTHNYWNYTVQKSNGDPSAKRYMTACTADQAPIVVGGIEWLPLDFKGQSFMLNQIRKMVSMVAMVVRCGSPLSIVQATFRPTRVTIPKAPPTGLLLEHPVFDAYNKTLDRLQDSESRGRIDFEKFREPIEQFKREHIVKPMHGIEENEAVYYSFLLGLDSLRSPSLLFFSAQGIPATERVIEGEEQLENVMAENEDEAGQGDDD